MENNLHEKIIYSADPYAVNSPAFYDSIVHLVCLQGCGTLIYNGRVFAIGKNQTAVINNPRQASFSAVSDDFICEYIAAPATFLRSLLPANNYSIQGSVSLFSNPVIDTDEKEADVLIKDIHNIMDRAGDAGHRFYMEMIGSLLQTMIYDLFDFHSRCNGNVLTTDRVGYITSRFFTLVRGGRPKTRRGVAHYAKELNVSSRYLSDTIRRTTGESVSVHINREAVNIMLELLKDNKLSATQIADEMQFNSLSHFSRFCRKHVGMSPAQIRVAGAKPPLV